MADYNDYMKKMSSPGSGNTHRIGNLNNDRAATAPAAKRAAGTSGATPPAVSPRKAAERPPATSPRKAAERPPAVSPRKAAERPPATGNSPRYLNTPQYPQSKPRPAVQNPPPYTAAKTPVKSVVKADTAVIDNNNFRGSVRVADTAEHSAGRTDREDGNDSERETDGRSAAVRRSARRQNELARSAVSVMGSILLVMVLIAVSAFLAQYLVRGFVDFAGIKNRDFQFEVEIPDNASVSQVAEILHAGGLIEMPTVFELYSKFAKKDTGYKRGLFVLSSTMPYSQIISALQSSSKTNNVVTVRIQNGMTGDEIGALLEKNNVCKAKDFLTFYKNYDNTYIFQNDVSQSDNKYNQLEGYLYPDTYEFYVDEDLLEDDAASVEADTMQYAEFAARKIYANYNDKYLENIKPYMKNGSITIRDVTLTLDEFMTVASMVQDEADTLDNMRNVASVFLNRLHSKGTFPKLESDVTARYSARGIIPHLNSNNVKYYTAMIDSYDTYKSNGLPPGPICNPGPDAIEAVLSPYDTDYYYFCADVKTREMMFAGDLAQHTQNLETLGIKISSGTGNTGVGDDTDSTDDDEE